jgi:hypothetical protein
MMLFVLIGYLTVWPAIYLLCHRLISYPRLKKAMDRTLGPGNGEERVH